MDLELANKTVLVTGASGGIGQTVARPSLFFSTKGVTLSTAIPTTCLASTCLLKVQLPGHAKSIAYPCKFSAEAIIVWRHENTSVI